MNKTVAVCNRKDSNLQITTVNYHQLNQEIGNG